MTRVTTGITYDIEQAASDPTRTLITIKSTFPKDFIAQMEYDTDELAGLHYAITEHLKQIGKL